MTVLWWLVLAAGWVLAGFLLVLIWSARSQRYTRVSPGEVPGPEKMLRSMRGLAGSPRVDGNRIGLLHNEDFFDALLRDIDRAEQSIHIEGYVWWQGDICERLATALARRADADVEVRVTLDALGAADMPDEQCTAMRDAGCRVAFYHDVRWRSLGRLNKRDHRKLAVFDGRLGYVFGHGFAAEWMSPGSPAPMSWRDSAARIEGPVVNQLQGVFAENWMEETAEVLIGEQYFPAIPPCGDVPVQVISSSPRGGVSNSSLLYRLLIASSRRSLLIQNPYFAPGREVIELLIAAVKRGVTVRIVVPGPVTDSAMVRHAGHYVFEDLLRGGVELMEFQPTLNHQKVVLVDGKWSYLGSANFDERSFDINCEVGVIMHDAGVHDELLRVFEADVESCRSIDLEGWVHRPLRRRLLDRMAYLLHEQL